VSNGAPAAKESIPALDPGRLPDLPSQSLFVDEPGGVLLETTAGRAIGLLRGFSVGGPQSPSDTQEDDPLVVELGGGLLIDHTVRL